MVGFVFFCGKFVLWVSEIFFIKFCWYLVLRLNSLGGWMILLSGLWFFLGFVMVKSMLDVNVCWIVFGMFLFMVIFVICFFFVFFDFIFVFWVIKVFFFVLICLLLRYLVCLRKLLL